MAIKNIDIQLKDKDSNNLYPLAHKDALGRVISDTYLTSVDVSGFETRVENVEELVDGAVSGISYSYAQTTSSTIPPDPEEYTYSTMPTVEPGKYVWRKSTVTKVDNTHSSYSPEMIQGLDGVSSEILSIVTRYAVSENGTDPTQIPSSSWQASIPSASSGSYLWTRVVTNYTTGVSSTSYSVAYQGVDGDDGVSISSVTNYYLATSYSSGVTTADGAWGTWSTTVQAMTSTKQYLWNYEKVFDSDSNILNTTSPAIIGRYGQNGRGISSITEYYQVTNSSSSSSLDPTKWVNPASSPMPVTSPSNMYLWNYEVITYTDNTTSQSAAHIVGTHGISAVSYSLLPDNYVILRNQAGSISPTSITFNLYSRVGDNNTQAYSGRFKIYTTINNSTWTAVYTSSSNESNYTLNISSSLPSGTTVANLMGIKCEAYLADGTSTLLDSQTIPVIKDGVDGLNVATAYLYKRDNSSGGPSGPTGVLRYTFSTGKLTSDNSSYFNGWSQDIPADNGSPCYVILATASSSSSFDDIATTEWSTPIEFVVSGTDGTDGDDAYNNATINFYKRSATALGNEKPYSSDVTYNFSTGQLSANPNTGWSRSIPTSDGNPCYVSSAIAISQSVTDVIEVSNWSTASVISEDGKDGLDGAHIWTTTTAPTTPDYTFAISNLIGDTSADVHVQVGDVIFYSVYKYTVSSVSSSTCLAGNRVSLKGSTGNAGLNNATVYLYKRSDSTPSAPSANTTYTFSTGVLSGTLDGWSQTIPDDNGLKCYVILATASSNQSTDTINGTASGDSQWSIPIEFVVSGTNGTDGDDGYNTATLYLYKRSATEPVIDSTTMATVRYTFSSGNWSTVPSGWSREVPNSNGNPCWMTTASAISRNSYVDITYNMWSEATKLVVDGLDGYNTASVFLYKRAASAPTSTDAKPSGTLTYTFSDGSLTPTSSYNGWSRDVPPEGTNKYPCYFIAATASSSSGSDTIPTSEWTSPVEFSSSGINTATINLYKRSSTDLTDQKPFSSGSVTYDFTDGTLSSTGTWSLSVPATDGNPCYVSSVTAISRGDTATISYDKWSGAQKLVEDGEDGEDAYSVILTNESHTFAGTSSAAIASSTSTQVLGYKGATQIKTVVANVTSTSATDISSTVGAPTGMTVSVTNSNTTSTTISISVTSSLTTQQGILTIPVKVDSTTFNMVFSYALALAGSDSISYDIIPSTYAFVRDQDNNITPTSITFSGYSQTGINSKVAYSGRFKIYTSTDNSTWSAVSTSTANETSRSYTIPANLKSTLAGIKGELYKAGGTSVLLDSQTVPVVDDGVDAYNVILTNEAHTFAAGTSAAVGGSTTVGVLGYRGSTQLATTVGTITGTSTALTATINNNGSTSTTITITATSSLTTQQGTLTIPVTVGGHTFEKIFSYSLARQGAPGGSGVNVSTVYLYKRAASASAAGKPSGTLTYHFTDGTLTGSNFNGWTQSVPADNGNACWLIAATASAPAGTETDDIASSEWTTDPIKFVVSGSAGVSISTITEYYLASSSSSGITTSTSGWTTDPTAEAATISASKPYLWNYEKVTGSNGSVLNTTTPAIIGRFGKDGQPGGTGPAGKGISSIVEWYAVSNNNTTSPGEPGSSVWKDKDHIPQTSQSTPYLWNYEVITYTDETTYTSTPVVIGTEGINGSPGANGYNTAIITVYQRAASTPSRPHTSGTFSYTFSSKTFNPAYASTWKDSIPDSNGNPCYSSSITIISQDATKTGISYSEWSAPVKMVENGTNGTNVATAYLYRRSSTALTSSDRPTGPLTYTFSTGKLTASSSSYFNSWSQAIPADDGNACYVTIATASSSASTDTITATEWSTPIQFVVSGSDGEEGPTGPQGPEGPQGPGGADGYNTATISLYKRSATAITAKPYSAAVTYTFSTGALSSTPSGWTRYVPSGTNPCYVSSVSAISKNATVSIPAANWTTPTLLVENGDDGVGIVEVKNLYYLSSTASTPAKPTAEVTRKPGTDSDTNVWIDGCPSYVEGYYYYTCLQTKKTDNTFAWSDVTLDSELTDAYSSLLNLQNETTNINNTLTALGVDVSFIQDNYIDANDVDNILSRRDYVAQGALDSLKGNLENQIDELGRLTVKSADLSTYFQFNTDGLTILSLSDSSDPRSGFFSKFSNRDLQFVDNGGDILAYISGETGVGAPVLSVGDLFVNGVRNQYLWNLKVSTDAAATHFRITKHA